MFDRLDDMLRHYEELMLELNNPSVAEDQRKFRKLMKEQADLAPIVDAYKQYKQAKQDVEDSLALLDEESDEEMKELAKEELADAKKGMLDARAVNRAQDAVVAQAWTSYLERGLDWTESKTVEEQILALTVEDVNKALRRFADPEGLTIVLAGDREKAREAGKDFFAK